MTIQDHGNEKSGKKQRRAVAVAANSPRKTTGKGTDDSHPKPPWDVPEGQCPHSADSLHRVENPIFSTKCNQRASDSCLTHHDQLLGFGMLTLLTVSHSLVPREVACHILLHIKVILQVRRTPHSKTQDANVYKTNISSLTARPQATPLL